jgi:acyl carrier protein
VDDSEEYGMSNVARRITLIAAQVLGIDMSDVTSDTRLEGDTPMQRVEFFMALEEEFGSVIPSDAAERFFTVKDAIEFISAKQG